jgi:hypothetical protein
MTTQRDLYRQPSGPGYGCLWCDRNRVEERFSVCPDCQADYDRKKESMPTERREVPVFRSAEIVVAGCEERE